MGTRAVIAAAGVLALIGASVLADPLESPVRTALGGAKLNNCRVGIAVFDCDTKETLASIEAQRAYVPASNLKLFTSGVALSVMGERFEFRTSFVVDGTRLVIKGAGDPGLGDPKLLEAQKSNVEAFIGRIVEAAREAKVAGLTEVVVDDRVFAREGDPVGVHQSWPRQQLNRWYCAPVTGLNFFTNVIELRARKGERVGMRPEILTEPKAPWLLNLEVAARTTRDGATSLWAVQDVNNPGFTFRVDGSVRENVNDPIFVSVNQPGLLFANLVAAGLRDAGLTEQRRLPLVRLISGNEEINTPEEKAFAVVTTPMDVVLKRCNTDSQNLYAECLLKRLAFEVTQQPGKWETGGQVVSMRVSQMLGQDIGVFSMADGSGMSADNQVTPWLMVRWLGAVRRDSKLFGPFVESMASGNDGGEKLGKRFKDRKLMNLVYGKTGLINGVRTISGYVVTPDSSRCIAYSVLVNNTEGTPAVRIMDFQEDVVQIIDRYLGKPAPATPAMGG